MQGPRNHVLVIDIDDDFLIAIERLLEDQGFDTATTWDVKEAARRLASEPFEVVLVCHHPPELNASDILPHLREVRKSSSYLVLQPTSGISPESHFFLSQGAKGVLCRWHPDDIVKHVRACLAEAQDPPAAAAAGRRAS
jgi:DNA-binding response OmpR family regulator